MRWFLAIPPLILLLLFTLSNADTVPLKLWPFDWKYEMPLSVAILTAAGLGLLLGGLLVWITELGQRRRARRAEETVRLLEEQIRDLKARLPVTVPPPGG